MNEQILKKLHSYQMELLLEVDRLAKLYDIKYFLVDGTLIGAAKYGGFIPWDDDIDVGMYITDYIKFQKICLEHLSDRFILQTYRNDENYGNFFSQFRIKNTSITQKDSSKKMKYNGIFIDIHPFVNSYSNTFFRFIHCAKFKYYKLISLYYHGGNNTQNGLKDKLFRFLSRKYNREYLIDKMEKIAFSKISQKTEIAVKISGRHLHKDYIFIDNLKKIIKLEFENYEFNVMPDYDRMLKNVYGNYMLITPDIKEKDYGIRHGISDIDFGQ